MGIKTFFLEPFEDLYEYSLRRFTYSMDSLNGDRPIPPCKDGGRGHDASHLLGWDGAKFAPELHEGRPCSGDVWPHNDPDWPKSCKTCGYVFQPEDEWQLFVHRMYRKYGTDERYTLRTAPVGAMWYADWMTHRKELSPDGRILVVRLPGNHDWMPEQRAANCDSPCKLCRKPYHAHKDKQGRLSCYCDPEGSYEKKSPQYEDSRPHLCWVRHGSPPHQQVHVDKSGVTCGAGAGSIAIPGWHGFLHNGELTT